MVFSVCQNLECRKNKDNISSFHPENPLILIRMQNKKALLIAQMESFSEQINQKPLEIANHL